MKVFMSFLCFSLATLSATAQNVTTDSLKERELGEAVAYGKKPMVKSHDGITVVDLPALIKDKPVSNVLEALAYLPNVTTSDGKLQLTGAPSVSIILNGEPTEMPVENLYRLLASLPADRLKSVEVMYAAPAKYHINGAVINVVLKTPRPIDGLQGQVRAGYEQRRYGSYGGGVAASYAVKDWSFYLNYDLGQNKNHTHENTLSNHLYNDVRHAIADDMRSKGKYLYNNIYATAAWKTIKLTYNGQVISNDRNTRISDGTLGKYTNTRRGNSPEAFHQIAIRYTAPFGLSAGGDYTHFSEDRSQRLVKDENLLLDATTRQNVNTWHAYLDQEHKAGRWTLGYGADYRHSDDRSAQHYAQGDLPTFDNVLVEDVVQAYLSIGHQTSWGLSFNTSAQAEYYHSTYQHNWRFIPQLGATFARSPKHVLQLNFNTQRVYPSYWALHGGASYLTDYAVVLGNPCLQPYMNYTGQLTYIFAQQYSATFYVTYDDKYSVQLPYQSPDAFELVYQTVNLDFARNVGFVVNLPFNVKGVWSATCMANVFNKREKAGHFHATAFDNRKWSFYGKLSNTFKPSSASPLAFSLDVCYLSPSTQGIGDISALWRMDAGMKYRFGKKRCAELSIAASDIFNTWSPTLRIDRSGQDFRLRTYDMTQCVKATLTWRFNGFKPKDTSVDTSRYGTGQ